MTGAEEEETYADSICHLAADTGAYTHAAHYTLADCQRDFRLWDEQYREYQRSEADLVSKLLYEETGTPG